MVSAARLGQFKGKKQNRGGLITTKNIKSGGRLGNQMKARLSGQRLGKVGKNKKPNFVLAKSLNNKGNVLIRTKPQGIKTKAQKVVKAAKQGGAVQNIQRTINNTNRPNNQKFKPFNKNQAQNQVQIKKGGPLNRKIVLKRNQANGVQSHQNRVKNQLVRPQNQNRNQQMRPQNQNRNQQVRPQNQNRNQQMRPQNQNRNQQMRPQNQMRNQQMRPQNQMRNQQMRPQNQMRNQQGRPQNQMRIRQIRNQQPWQTKPGMRLNNQEKTDETKLALDIINRLLEDKNKGSCIGQAPMTVAPQQPPQTIYISQPAPAPQRPYVIQESPKTFYMDDGYIAGGKRIVERSRPVVVRRQGPVQVVRRSVQKRMY